MKKYLFGLIALLLVVAGSAFVSQGHNAKVTDTVWFEYDPINGNGPTDPANYVETGENPVCSMTEGELCSVFAEADDNTGSVGNRKPLATSLSTISSTYGFDDYEDGVIHLRD